MWLRKITKLKSVGKFLLGGISGGEYGKYTIFYGGNGRGKTTLSSVLHSLSRNDPTLVLERKSFGAANPTEIQLLLASGNVTFSSDKWSSHEADVHIFDQRYIGENIHGGEQIDVEQRRNLYRIVIGPKGVQLTKEIEELDQKVTAKQAEIAAEKKALQQHVPQKSTLEKFLSLPIEEEVDKKIETAEKELKALENAAELKKKALIVAAPIPTLPADFEALIDKTIEGISSETIAKVQQQIQKHSFIDGGEEWLSLGLMHATEDCPFCEQNIKENQLVDSYNAYFSDAYTSLKTDLVTLEGKIGTALSEAAMLKLANGLDAIARDRDYWQPYISGKLDLPPLPDNWKESLTLLQEAAQTCVSQKIAAPLEIPAALQETMTAFQSWKPILEEISTYNAAALMLNPSIQSVKESLGKGDVLKSKEAIAALKSKKIRHSEPVLSLAQNYAQLLAEKDSLVAQKDSKKVELDTHDAAVFAGYEADINLFLSQFGASFRLTKSTKTYVGKLPQSSYCIKFGNAEIDVGAKTSPGEPSFGSSMSAGDKSTLALAFFLAQLNRDPEIAKKLVVFDDPFSSLDDFRREMTAKNIVRVGKNASQVLVFSHDKYFLYAIWEKIHDASPVSMQISSTAGNSHLEPWDIEREVKEGYLQDHMTLLDFAEGKTSDAKPMRTLMRPLLEKYIRYRFPNQIADGMWLGDMLKIIKENPGHPLTPLYSELDDINEYTAPFHHDPNTSFNSDEVMTHVKRTLAIVGGS